MISTPGHVCGGRGKIEVGVTSSLGFNASLEQRSRKLIRNAPSGFHPVRVADLRAGDAILIFDDKQMFETETYSEIRVQSLIQTRERMPGLGLVRVGKLARSYLVYIVGKDEQGKTQELALPADLTIVRATRRSP